MGNDSGSEGNGIKSGEALAVRLLPDEPGGNLDLGLEVEKGDQLE